jgi:hypothetical protein
LWFNREFRGFGGEEGYIHEKYRQAGNKVYCIPWLMWWHLFKNGTGRGTPPYPALLKDKVRNYIIGFKELGLDMQPLYEQFGEEMIIALS